MSTHKLSIKAREIQPGDTWEAVFCEGDDLCPCEGLSRPGRIRYAPDHTVAWQKHVVSHISGLTERGSWSWLATCGDMIAFYDPDEEMTVWRARAT